ncbi:ISAs1 family transposase [Pelagibaculum spongiae]|uniref:ISAs1 family transposase n=1 Tax=Pelagibaculum spongiae TaxID=2080658 RepID=A0A2V1GXT6_9GAMM|nr:ISAs1 family transposase [Pelagibaculum spongiae]PVZ68186.1 ISAs1 family transposase [Pelagibaculum spongiae]PVZ71756.1 ISAs1 family transposase [Pelagibaculum spongiae]PVZ71971.1 ISAs1 family transposase [Pelagibaculum spongiae]
MSPTVLDYFSDIEDPRQKGKVTHSLDKILLISLCGMLCGADDWETIETFAENKQAWLGQFVDMSDGVPSHDTLGRVFSRIRPEQFTQCFIEWVQGFIEQHKDVDKETLSVIALDGKTARRSQDKRNSKSAMHMMNAWCCANQLVLGQLVVDEKTNEITALPDLLKLIDAQGSIITADALNCQKDITQACIESGADYLLAVKGNQPTLHEYIHDYFEKKKPKAYRRPEINFFESSEKNRNRDEIRRCWVADASDLIPNRAEWTSLNSIVRIDRSRTIDEKTSFETHYYICSNNQLSAEEVLSAARQHWQVEIMHWTLDMCFREDEQRARKDYSAENMTIMRQVSMNLLKHDKTPRLSMKRKRLVACMNESYLEKLLFLNT